MTIDDRHHGDGVTHSPVEGRAKRHRKIAVGAVSLAALIGGGAYLGISQTVDQGNAVTGDPGALDVLVPSATAPASVSAVPSTAATTGVMTPSATAPSLSSPSAASSSRAPQAVKTTKPVDSKKVQRQIQAAREAAEKDGHPVARGFTAKGGPVAASQRNETTAAGTLRVITARGDLSGQRELLWAADRGVEVGSAQCTQKFRFSPSDPGRERPSMLLCWRTSAKRSVVTLAVAKKGRPSAASSASVIDKEWAKLG